MKRTISSGAVFVGMAYTLLGCATENPPKAPVTAASTPAPSATPVASPSDHAEATATPPIMTRTMAPGIDGKTPKSECDKDSDCKANERCQHPPPNCTVMKAECMFSKCVAK